MQRRTFLKSAGSASVASLTFSGAARAWSPPDSLSPVAAAAADWSGYTLPDATLTYDDQPRWIVRAADDAGVQSVRDWAGKSSARTVLAESAYVPRVTVAAPTPDMLGKNDLASTSSGLAAESYVELVDVDLEVRRAPPVDDLASASAWEQYQTPWTLRRGEWQKKGIAFSDDAQKVDAADVRARAGAGQISHSGGNGVKIAVLDTGCNYASSEFDSRLKYGKNFLTGNTIDPANSDYAAVEDGNLHGTWCCSMASGNAGFASSATLAAGKVLADDGSGSVSNIVEGIRWAAEDVGADVLSMSLGSPLWSEAMARALDDFVGSGTAVFCASGNSRPQWTASPSDSEHAIGVGASNTLPGEPASDLEIAYFSQTGPDGGTLDTSSLQSRGQRPQVHFPGMKIAVPVPRTDGSVSGYRLSGTSMATPGVAGLATVFLGDHAGVVGDTDKLRDRLTRTVKRTPLIGKFEGGAGVPHLPQLYDDTRTEMDRAPAAKARDIALRSASGALGPATQALNPSANYLHEV